LLVRFFGLCFFALFCLSTSENLGKGVPNAAEEQGAEEIFEGDEGIVDTQQNGRELKVNEEDYYAEIDQGVWRRNEVRLFVQHEYDGCHEAGFCVTEKKVSQCK